MCDPHLKSDIKDCRIIKLPKHEHPNGSLTVMENTVGAPFAIKRVFYLYDVPADSSRGGHSHFHDHQFIIAASGAFEVTVEDGKNKHTYRLDRPYEGLHVPPGIWRTLQNFSSGSVCLVMTSEAFDEADYVREYDEFLRLTACKRSETVKYPFLSLKRVNAPYAEALKEAACRVIDSGYYVGGPEVEALEKDLCKIAGTPYAVAVSNGLDALRLIFRGYMELGYLSQGDEVIVPSDTYIASVLAVTDCGLKPVFVEPRLDTYNLDSSLIEEAITERTRAILPVHLYGRTCWDAKLAEIATRHNLLVVEDNAQAIGAESNVPGLYGTHLTGGLGHAGAFSFYPTKNIGALGDAGTITTHDAKLAETVRALRSYGSLKRYHNIYPGLNCRMDPIQAAMLRVKLPYLQAETEHRRQLARIYCEEIKNPAVTLPIDDGRECVWHQFVVRVKDRERFRAFLLNNGVETSVNYPAAPHCQPCYSQYSHLQLPIAEQIANEVVSLPLSAGTSPRDAYEIAQIVNRAFIEDEA